MVKILGIASAVLLFALMFLVQVIKLKDKAIDQLTVDNGQLLTLSDHNAKAAKIYINEYDQEVSKNKVLTLSNRNLKQLIEDPRFNFLKQFDGINKKLNHLEATVQVQASIIKTLKLKTADTVIVSRVSGLDSIVGRSFKYSDPFNKLTGFTVGDTTLLSVESQVPLDGVVYLGKRTKKFLFVFRVGPREASSEFTSANPWAHITGSEYIKILKQ